MKSNEITLELVMNGRRLTQELDVVSFVKKPIENFVYKQNTAENRVALTYVESQKMFSDQNIFINNKSIYLKENRVDFLDKENKFFTIEGKTLNVPYKDIYITNVSTIDKNNKEVPLFYIHEIAGKNISLKIESNIDEFEEKAYKIEEFALYHNFENFFDEKSGEYLIYFVEYLDNEGEYKREILQSNNVIRELTWEDIDLNTGLIKEGIKGYQITSNTAEYTFDFNESEKYYWVPKETNSINLNKPIGREVEDNWFIEVSSGEFKTIFNGKLLTYKVNEYDNQYFRPIKPFSFKNYYTLDWVSEKLLSADTKSIVYSFEREMDVEIFVFDESKNLIRCLTTKQHNQEKRYGDTDLFWESNVINSVDRYKGFIELNEKFSSRYTYKANFFYEEKKYAFNLINLNPGINKSLKNHFYSIYIIPNLDYYEQSLHYLKIDKNGIIVECSQGAGIKEERANFPALSLRDEDGNLNTNTIIGKRYSYFKEQYGLNFNNTENYLILGEIGYIENNDPEKVFKFSVKEKGKSIKKDRRKNVFRKNYKLLQSVYGYGAQGYKYRIDKSALLEVPLNLIEKYGGQLTEEEVIETIERVMPAACKNIIKWIHPESKVEVSNSVVGQIDFEMKNNINPDEEYLIYKKEFLEREYELLTTLSQSTKNFTDTEVDSEKIYYYKVRIKKSDIIFPEIEEVEVYVR